VRSVGDSFAENLLGYSTLAIIMDSADPAEERPLRLVQLAWRGRSQRLSFGPTVKRDRFPGCGDDSNMVIATVLACSRTSASTSDRIT
jgi:hypothetical protein